MFATQNGGSVSPSASKDPGGCGFFSALIATFGFLGLAIGYSLTPTNATPVEYVPYCALGMGAGILFGQLVLYSLHVMSLCVLLLVPTLLISLVVDQSREAPEADRTIFAALCEGADDVYLRALARFTDEVTSTPKFICGGPYASINVLQVVEGELRAEQGSTEATMIALFVGLALHALAVFVDLALLLLAACSATSDSLSSTALYLLWINLVAFLAFGADKILAMVVAKEFAAVRGAARLTEVNLHALGALGGSIGGVIAMWLFGHKSSKGGFQLLFGLASIAGPLAFAALCWSARR